ncbi:MAG: hypothetical protein ACI8WB_001818 [Phenylobacterium sp.]|jgi:hypothetical protein
MITDLCKVKRKKMRKKRKSIHSGKMIRDEKASHITRKSAQNQHKNMGFMACDITCDNLNNTKAHSHLSGLPFSAL